MQKERIDVLLVEQGLAESRSQAQRLLMAGQVRVDGQVVLKPATVVSTKAIIGVERGPRYVSRGGEKLEAALLRFQIGVAGRSCADVGASTGGFTDCLIKFGAARVYAIDVGSGILHWKLRQDKRVVIMENTNARYLTHLPEVVSIVTIDVSFISIKMLLHTIRSWFSQEGGEIIALIKPQFEAGRREVSRGAGVIRDPEVHREVLYDVLNYACGAGYDTRGLMRSPLLGPKGNVEFLAWMGYPGKAASELNVLISTVTEGCEVVVGDD
jgi:23S rRNA (cytidine1920-2'-O)/16S rRNA (cytidine1409-2'-O)-methyltransferase